MRHETAAIRYREAVAGDVPSLARLRSQRWGSPQYWQDRIEAYLSLRDHPRGASTERIVLVAQSAGGLIGFIAGHLSTRFECQGELQWLDVDGRFRRRRVASGLLGRLAEWFGERHTSRVCVDVEPDNTAARRFYATHGAIDLRPHWMVWQDIVKAGRRRSRQHETGKPKRSEVTKVLASATGANARSSKPGIRSDGRSRRAR